MTTLTFHELESSDDEMDSWTTLREAIPGKMITRVAERMHVSPDFIRRWRREPLSNEAPRASGMASPLTRCCLLIDSIATENPHGASLIAEHVVLHYQRLVNVPTIQGFGGSIEERALASAGILTQATKAVISLNVDGVTEETLSQLVLLRDAAHAAIQRVGKDLYYHQPRMVKQRS